MSLQSGQSTERGEQVACVNPAAIGGGAGDLDPYYLTVTRTGPSVPTNWVSYPDLYRARCETAGGATWLQVTQAGRAGGREVASEDLLGPSWGFHLDELSLTLGNLLHDLAAEEASWEAHHG